MSAIQINNVSKGMETINSISEINKLLEEDKRKIKLGHKEIVLVLGITGSGKTTLVQHLAGDENKLFAKEADENINEFTIEDTDGKISANSTIVSKTIFPELVIDPKSNTAYYDCPGFGDTRETKIDIAGTYFIKQVIKNAKKLKIVLTVDYSSVRKGGSRGNFKTLLEHVLNLIKNPEKYSRSIALVVTKVENQTRKEGTQLIPVSDEVIINNIAMFLEMFKENVEKVATREWVQRAKNILDILLTKNKLGYERIGLFHRPDQPGLLSKMESLLNDKAYIKKMIAENIVYTNVNENDFGYTISEKSKNDIHDMIDNINNNISTYVSEIGQAMQKYYEIKEKESNDIYQFHKDVTSSYERIQNFSDNLKNINLTDFVEQLFNLTRELHINMRKTFVYGILQQNKHLQLLKNISQMKKDESSAIMWSGGLSQAINYFNGSRKWYNFLITLYDELSSYNVQKNKKNFEYILHEEITDINNTKLKQFIEKNTKNVQFMEIVNLKIDSVKLNTLKRLILSTLSTNISSHYAEYTRTYEIRGDYVLMSAIDYKYVEKAKFLNIFATDKIFIDENLINTERGLQQVSIIAPTWEIIGQRNIILNGKEACCPLTFRASDGYNVGAAGYDGVTGVPGLPAGNFFGVGARFFNGNDLVIFANGGRGSSGQDGGNGAPGFDGAGPKDGKDSHYFRTERINCGFLCVRRSYCIYGEGGGNGGNGGHGGLGGEGGFPGSIQLLTLQEHPRIVSKNEKGQDGDDGLGGRGGRAGRSGTSIETDKLLWWWKSARVSKRCSKWDTYRDGQPGKNGITGGSTKNKQIPIFIPTARKSKIVTNYKEFLQEKLNIENLRQGKRIEILNMLNENSSIVKLFGTIDLVEEFIGLENQYTTLKTNVNLIPIYQNLLQRVETYAAKPKVAENWQEHKRVLSTLYAAILSKICAVKENPRNWLITDIRKYLDSTISDIKENKLITDEYQENYAIEINNLIEEITSFVEKYIIVEIDNISKIVQENIWLLVQKINEIELTENSYVNELHRELQHNLIVMNIIEVPNQIAHLLKSLADRAKKIMVRTASINEYLVLDNVAEEKGFTIITEVKKSLPILNINIERELVSKALLIDIMKNLTNSLKNISSDKLVTINEYENKIKNITNDDAYIIKNELNNLLEVLIKDFQNEKQDEMTMETLQALHRARNTMKICDAGVKNCAKIRDNQEINILDKTIDSAKMRLIQVQFYMTELQEQVQSLLKIIGDETTDITTSGYEVIKSGLTEIKILMQDVKNSFILPENLLNSFERLERGSNAIMNIYDLIEYYQYLNRLRMHIKNVSSNKVQKDFLSNEELKNALGSLNAIIESNLLLALYHHTITASNRSMFPFADSYASTLNLDISEVEDLRSKILYNIQNLKSLFEKSAMFLNGIFDKDVYQGDFTTINNTVESFYTWKNEDYGNTISALLDGNEIILKADITQGIAKQAVKFNKIEVKFKSSVEDIQQQLDNDLQDFYMSLTYLGDSTYRCGGNYYILIFENFQISYSLAKRENGEPTYTNKLYDKIKNGDYVLSPYATWSIQLKGSNFDKLKKYSHLVDIELQGHGQFIEHTNFCNCTLGNYYKIDKTISEKIVTDENQLDLQDVLLQLPNQNVAKDFHSSPITNDQKQNRKRRSIESNDSSVYKSYKEMYPNAQLNHDSVINWPFNGLSKMLTVNSSHFFNGNVIRIFNKDHSTNSMVTLGVQYNINDSLILTDLLVRKITKLKPSYVQECATNFVDVHACALAIIAEFENILESMSTYDGEFDFDPVTLMSKLEAELLNGDHKKLSKILLYSIADKSQFDENTFYHRLKLLSDPEEN